MRSRRTPASASSCRSWPARCSPARLGRSVPSSPRRTTLRPTTPAGCGSSSTRSRHSPTRRRSPCTRSSSAGRRARRARMTVHVEQAAFEVVLPLRAAVLRAGLPVDTARYDQDTAEGTVHLAAVDGDGRSSAARRGRRSRTTAGRGGGCAAWRPPRTCAAWRGRAAGETGLDLGRRRGARSRGATPGRRRSASTGGTASRPLARSSTSGTPDRTTGCGARCRD